jgi:long-chain fatty acid transport protein
MRLKRLMIVFFSLFFLFFACTGAWAVVVGPDILGIDFRFNNPGARANAMGGAFIGLADDATAAYTNPAGLTVLTEPEFSLEYKIGEITTEITDRIGTAEYDDTISGLSFLSYVYPTENATIAFFRHQLLNTQSNYDWRDSATRINKIDVSLDAVTLGIGAGFKLTDAFSVGLSIGMAQLDYNVTGKGYDTTATSYPDEDDRDTVSEIDNAEHYTVSLLWNPFGEMNIGLVYRMGPEFETKKQRHDWNSTVSAYILEWERDHILKVPDIYGIGFSYRFFPNLTASLDVNYIEYSDLADNFLNDNGSKETDWEVEDQVEVRFGLEFIFEVNQTPLALRAGYYFRPDHGFIYTGPDPSFRQTFGKADDDDHIFSLGFGAALTEKFQLDVAAAAGQYIKEGSLSIVYRF